jgi:hypothetical protein
MSLTKTKSQIGKLVLALALGLALAWSVVVSGATGQQEAAGYTGPNSVVVADGNTNPPPGSG